MESIVAALYELISTAASWMWSVFTVIGMWLVFQKAGDKGWKAIIPFYNMYTMFNLGERKKYWLPYLIGSIVYLVSMTAIIAYFIWALLALVLALGAVDGGLNALESCLPLISVAGIAAIAGYGVMMIAAIHGYSGICKKMGQGAGMVVGLVFLAPIFWMILGAGKQYQWVQENTVDVPVTEYQPPEWHDPYQISQQ